MTDTTSTVRVSIEVPLEPSAAFDLFMDELILSLVGRGIRFEVGAEGRLLENGFQVGRVVAWEPGQRIRLDWHQAEWDPSELTQVELHFEPVDGRTRVTLEHRGWGRLIGNPADLAGWFADQVAAPLLGATAPGGFGDWLTDRRARRPSGQAARGVYRDPLYHYPNFRVILTESRSQPG